MKRHLLFSDGHLRKNKGQNALVGIIEEFNPDVVVAVGDVHDKDHYIHPENQPLIEYLKLKAKNGELIHLAGNHDPDDESILGIKTQKSYVIETDEGEQIIVIHGDIFDRFLDFIDEGIDDFLTWASEKLQDWGLFDHWTTKWLTSHGCGLFSGLFTMRAKGFACRYGYGTVICGHIHSADEKLFRVKKDGKWHAVRYFNCGHWTGRQHSYITIDEHGNIKLHFINTKASNLV